MDWADSELLGPGWPDELAGLNTDLAQLVAAAADLCRKPLRHGVVLSSPSDDLDCSLRLEARCPEGERHAEQDLDLEIFRSGSTASARLHLTLAWTHDDTRPMLWHGPHPVWMDGEGCRTERPADGVPSRPWPAGFWPCWMPSADSPLRPGR